MTDVSTAITLFAKGKTDPQKFRALMRQNPVAAIQCLESGNTELTTKGNANALDEVIGAIGDDMRATQLIAEHMTPSRLVELMAAQGELGSAVILVADPDLVIQAMMEDIGSGAFGDDANSLYCLRAWALKLKDRKDWDEILEREILDRSLFDWFVWASWLWLGCPDLVFFRTNEDRDLDGEIREPDEDEEEEESNTPVGDSVVYRQLLALFEEVGLDCTEAENRLRKLHDSDELKSFGEEELLEAKLAFTTRREERANAPKVEAEEVAEGLDIGE